MDFVHGFQMYHCRSRRFGRRAAMYHFQPLPIHERFGLSHPAESRLPSYGEWLEERIVARRTSFPDVPAPGMFSVITPAFNTPPALLQECADSILGQEGGDNVEWILVDNG